MFNRFVCATLLATFLPGFTLPLVTPLKTPVPGYSTTFLEYWPKLELDAQSKQQSPLNKALLLLKNDAAEPSTDDLDLIISALKAANEDQANQGYLEGELGYAIANVQAWLKLNLPRTYRQRVLKAKDELQEGLIRKAVGITALGLGAGVGIISIPIAFTGVGLIPGLMLTSVSTELIEAGIKIMQKPENASVISKAMPDLMVAMLGNQESQPYAPVDWNRFSYAPTEELVKRLRRAALVRQAFEAMGTTELTKLDDRQTLLLTTVQELYARDLVHITMLLSVISRQVNEGRHLEFTASLLAALPADTLAPLALAAHALGDTPDTYLGVTKRSLDDQKSPDLVTKGSLDPVVERRREVTHFARWVEASVLLRTAAGGEVDGSDIRDRVESMLGQDADYKTFEDARARQTIAKMRESLPEEQVSPNRLKRLKNLVKRLRP